MKKSNAVKHKIFNRNLLPTPLQYYKTQFPNLKPKSEWAKVCCCFHQPDNNPSLNISMVGGHFKCFACGAKGGNIITFHRLRYQTSFVSAVDFMGAWRYE